MAETIREGSYVWIRDDRARRPYRVRHIGIALGHHYQFADLDPVYEAMVQTSRRVQLDRLELIPPDLEDFPCSPV